MTIMIGFKQAFFSILKKKKSILLSFIIYSVFFTILNETLTSSTFISSPLQYILILCLSVISIIGLSWTFYIFQRNCIVFFKPREKEIRFNSFFKTLFKTIKIGFIQIIYASLVLFILFLIIYFLSILFFHYSLDLNNTFDSIFIKSFSNVVLMIWFYKFIFLFNCVLIQRTNNSTKDIFIESKKVLKNNTKLLMPFYVILILLIIVKNYTGPIYYWFHISIQYYINIINFIYSVFYSILIVFIFTNYILSDNKE